MRSHVGNGKKNGSESRLVWSLGTVFVTLGCSSQFCTAQGTEKEVSGSSRSCGGDMCWKVRPLYFPGTDGGDPVPGERYDPLILFRSHQQCCLEQKNYTAIFVCRDKLPVHLNQMSLLSHLSKNMMIKPLRPTHSL